MSKWKKILIISFAAVAFALAAMTIISITEYCHYKFRSYEYPLLEKRISPYITMIHSSKGGRHYCRLKDVRTGKYTTPKLQHVFISENSKDSLVVFRTDNHLRGYININTGKIVIPAQYDRAWNYSEGLAAVIVHGEVLFLNEQGEMAFPATFPFHFDDSHDNYSFMFHNGLCAMINWEHKWGLINTQGEWVVEPIYNEIDAPYHGYRRVYDGEHYGLLAQDGSLALPVVYNDIRREPVGNGWILVKDGLAWQVDFDLQITVPFLHDGIHTLSYIDSYDSNEYYDEASDEYKTLKQSKPRFFRFDIGANSGVIDANGKVIIPAIFFNVYIVNDQLFEVEVTSSGERLLYDTKGRYVGKAGI